MFSTIERDVKLVNGIMTFPMKEYPDWYGIPNVGFIWRNEWSDPEIEYNGERINSTIVEDTMLERFKEEYGEDEGNSGKFMELFKRFMLNNMDDVYELIEIAIENLALVK